VLVSWDGNIATDPLARRLHEAVLNNFDFDYLYNFVFDPEKVKGQPYKPRRSPDFTEPTVVLEASAAATLNASDTNVHFFDDFSTTVPGKSPIGWAVGIAGLVTTLDGLPGNWGVLAGDFGELTAKRMNTPLPQNFTVSYDLVVPQNFTWGARRMTFELASAKSARSAEWYVRLGLRPGYDGRAGEASIETKVPAGYVSGNKWAEAPGLSNNKKYNRIAVAIRKVGDSLQVFIDDKKVIEYPKALPSDLVFNMMSFRGNNNGPNDKFYVSNIKNHERIEAFRTAKRPRLPPCDPPQLIGLLIHPGVDGWIPRDRTMKAQKLIWSPHAVMARRRSVRRPAGPSIPSGAGRS
jgi:hypothetical protein